MTQFQPKHVGITISDDELAQVQAKKDAPEFAEAWAQLGTMPSDAEPLTQAMWLASQYRLGGDTAAGEKAVRLLQTGVGWDVDTKTIRAMRQTVASIQAFELVRDHPAWQGQETQWLDSLQHQLQRFASLNEPRALELIWQVPLQIVAGIAFDDATLFQAGCDDFERIINDYVHPEGYLKPLVVLKDGKSFQRQQSGITALVIAAEAATHAGRNLWQYDDRGVSLATGIAYQVYYYFFPEKWRWEEEGTYTEDGMRDAFTQGGAYLEIGGMRTRPRSLEMLLEEMRPMVDVLGGGFTTLTHGIDLVIDKRKKRRGLFGRG